MERPVRPDCRITPDRDPSLPQNMLMAKMLGGFSHKLMPKAKAEPKGKPGPKPRVKPEPAEA